MNYPKGIKPHGKRQINYSNRGMSLEGDINLTNEYYRDKEIAYIYKKPTPIQITKVKYPSRSQAVITEAYFKEPSTTDYNGLYKGKYVDFEAKETNNLSFPLANIHKHQINHIRAINKNKGVCFLIVRFNKYSKTFLLLANDFIDYIDNNTRKSIPLSFFEKNAFIIEENYIPRIDYIKILDKLLEVSNDK